MSAKIITTLLLLLANQQMFTMLTLTKQTSKSSVSTVFRSCLAHQGSDKNDSMKPNKKIGTEKGFLLKRCSKADIRQCNILDQNFKWSSRYSV
jgi:hypothetical protein